MTALRCACMEQVAELRPHPMLKTLALRCVTYDEPAKRLVCAQAMTISRSGGLEAPRLKFTLIYHI